MISTKNFLSQECDSVRSVLNETLRHEYGSDGSREFFEECEDRLNFIASELFLADEADHQKLRHLGALLTSVSVLISWIERSSISEYSWPFVEELKKIAFAICTEATIDDPSTPPKVHVMSEGGVARYAIAAERKRPFPSKRRILTIIFPRSLKHFVLLHPLLGHELGHAIWRGSEHEAALIGVINSNLITAYSLLGSADLAAEWLYSPNAPQPIKDDLADLHKRGVSKDNFFTRFARWDAWIEEITCDLIGLLTFGPSFIAAHCQALYAVAPSGGGFGSEHPPVGCRINLMLQAVSILGYAQVNLQGESLQMVESFWRKLEEKKQADTWFDVFPEAELANTIQGISALLSPRPPAHYPEPNEAQLAELLRKIINHVPPVGFTMGADRAPACERVDFRHILYAGWVAAANQPAECFPLLNQLCEHGIMQQRAIDMYIP